MREILLRREKNLIIYRNSSNKGSETVYALYTVSELSVGFNQFSLYKYSKNATELSAYRLFEIMLKYALPE